MTFGTPRAIPSDVFHELAAFSEPAKAPSDPEVQKVADKLAQFVAANGRSFENITRERNPGDTPFR